jgi:hypothetical protein
LKHVLRFENENLEALGFGTLSNVVIYATDSEIKRLNLDEMRKKLKQDDVTMNPDDIKDLEDLRKIVTYDESTDDVRYFIDTELEYKKAPNTILRGHSDRKALKLKVFDDQGVFVVVMSSPLKS